MNKARAQKPKISNFGFGYWSGYWLRSFIDVQAYGYFNNIEEHPVAYFSNTSLTVSSFCSIETLKSYICFEL